MWCLRDTKGLAVCGSCPLDSSKKIPSVHSDEDAVEVLIIGQSPGKIEVSAGVPFGGPVSQLVMPVIRQYTNKVAIVNTILCRPINIKDETDRTPISAELKACRPRFINDIDRIVNTFKPKLVLVLGGVAKREVNRLLAAGKYKNVNFHFLEHPNYINRNNHLKGKYVTEMHNVLRSVFSSSDIDGIIGRFVTYEIGMEKEFLRDVYDSRNVGVDIETNMLNTFDPKFVIGTVAVSCDSHTYFFDCRENGIDFYSSSLIVVLVDVNVVKIFANILFDVIAFHSHGITVNNYVDLFPLAFLYDNTFLEYNLEAIVMRYFPELASYKSRFHSQVIDNNYLMVDATELMIYNCFDALVTKQLYNHLYDKISGITKKTFDRISNRLLPVLVNIKLSGMKIDVVLLDKYEAIFKKRYEELVKLFAEKYKITNINSTVQIKKWLFTDLKLKPFKKTDNGSPSTDKEVLEVFAAQIPDVRVLYEARRIASLLNYFIPSIRSNLDDNDFIHPNYKHYGIQSFRLSCLSPNLQGIPRDKTDIEILDKYPLRRLFVARLADSYIVEFDYSQQEVRIIAELSRESNMIKEFKEGGDIHRFVASILFHKDKAAIKEQERQIAKSCVFGAIFGASPKEISTRLHIPEQEAKAYVDRFFVLFPGIFHYLRRQHDIVLDKKVIHSMLGRPRKFIIHQDNRNNCKREAANHTIQSVAADVTFVSLIDVHNWLQEEKLLNESAFMVHTVHDSILLDVRSSCLDYVIKEVKRIMSSVPSKIGFHLKFPVDVKVGRSWGNNINKEVLDVAAQEA